MVEEYQSWGGLDFGRQQGQRLQTEMLALPAPDNGQSMLGFGNGRSYGDVGLNTGGLLLDCRALNRILDFDPQRGLIRCQAGTLLGDIITHCLPQGWFLPVTPGTQYVTLAGAVANDVHGKNHHRLGSFGCHVTRFELLRSGQGAVLCSANQHQDLFNATIGGLGLTGLITWVELQLIKSDSSYMNEEVIRFAGLSDYFTLAAESDGDWAYTVAWVDCLAKGKAMGRGIFYRANHAAADTAATQLAPRKKHTMPVTPPFSLANKWSIRLFNGLYFHKQSARRQSRMVDYQKFFYPLDSIGKWNRLYGPRGFYQYQCVLPPAAGEAGMAEILSEIARQGNGSFLAVLKNFGDVASPGLLSFPRPGVTLALDFPNDGSRVLRLMERLDAVVNAAGGALYPAKDARMPAAMFQASFPNLDRFRAFIDPAFSSSFWRRVDAQV